MDLEKYLKIATKKLGFKQFNGSYDELYERLYQDSTWPFRCSYYVGSNKPPIKWVCLYKDQEGKVQHCLVEPVGWTERGFRRCKEESGQVYFPVFKSYLPKEKEKMKPVENTAKKVVEDNKVAASIVAKLGAGKVANRFLIGKFAAKLPWYSRLFGGAAKMQENALAKMVAAQTANALATHFAKDNAKLKYISEAMLQDAMYDMTVNSNVLERLVTELEGMVKLPESLTNEISS